MFEYENNKEKNLDAKILHYLDNFLFHKVTDRLKGKWPIFSMDSIHPGIDLSIIWKNFILFILEDERHGIINMASGLNKHIVSKIIHLYHQSLRGEVDKTRFKFIGELAFYNSTDKDIHCMYTIEACALAYYSQAPSVYPIICDYAASAYSLYSNRITYDQLMNSSPWLCDREYAHSEYNRLKRDYFIMLSNELIRLVKEISK